MYGYIVSVLLVKYEDIFVINNTSGNNKSKISGFNYHIMAMATCTKLVIIIEIFLSALIIFITYRNEFFDQWNNRDYTYMYNSPFQWPHYRISIMLSTAKTVSIYVASLFLVVEWSCCHKWLYWRILCISIKYWFIIHAH